MAESGAGGTKEEGWLKRTIRRFGSDDLFVESFFNSMGAFVNLALAALNGYDGFSNHNPWSQFMALWFLVLGLITLYMAVRHAFQRVTLAASIGGLVMLELQLISTFGQGMDPVFVVALETVTAVVSVAVLVVFGVSLLVKVNGVDDVAM